MNIEFSTYLQNLRTKGRVLLERLKAEFREPVIPGNFTEEERDRLRMYREAEVHPSIFNYFFMEVARRRGKEGKISDEVGNIRDFRLMVIDDSLSSHFNHKGEYANVN